MAKNKLNGWLIIDKPYQTGSTNVVSKLKWLLKPERIGHAGTLDPLATGVLPIAFGSATKTIPFVMDGQKTYQFEVAWGTQTTTDDVEGSIELQSDKRPTQAEIEAVLPQFIGTIRQTPPAYSALKVNGRRAYDLARAGQEVILQPREIRIDSLKILSHTPEKTLFEVHCGKGTYVRSIGHDLGQKLGCYGHITFLRRTKCGPFDINMSILLETLEKEVYTDIVSHLVSPLTALDDILVLAVNDAEKEIVQHGGSLSFSSENHPTDFEKLKNCSDQDIIALQWQHLLCALAKYEKGKLKPFRVFAV